MAYEIVFECRSVNNKNIRNTELKILRKFEDKLYFEFGEDESNIKKRFYNDVKCLNEDFEQVQKIKEKLQKQENEENEENEEIKAKAEKIIDNITEAIVTVEQEETFKKAKTKSSKKHFF